MKTTPGRVRDLKKAMLSSHGKTRLGGWTTKVLHTAPDCVGDEYECIRHGEMTKEKRPEWWKTGELNEIEWFSVSDVDKDGLGGHGVNYVISEPDGLVFAER